MNTGGRCAKTADDGGMEARADQECPQMDHLPEECSTLALLYLIGRLSKVHVQMLQPIAAAYTREIGGPHMVPMSTSSMGGARLQSLAPTAPPPPPRSSTQRGGMSSRGGWLGKQLLQ